MKSFKFLVITIGMLVVLSVAGLAQNVDAIFQQGLSDFKAEQYEKALVSFQRVVKISPTNADAHYNIGSCYSILRTVF